MGGIVAPCASMLNQSSLPSEQQRQDGIVFNASSLRHNPAPVKLVAKIRAKYLNICPYYLHRTFFQLESVENRIKD